MSEQKSIQLGSDEFAEAVRLSPLVSIDLIVHNSRGEILLGLRENEPAKGFWFVPGGRILKNERISEAFERLAVNELGVKLNYKDAKFIGVFEHLYANNFAGREGFGTHYIVLAHSITIDASTLDLPDDQHSDYKWMNPQDVCEDSTVHPYTKAYFNCL
ncbi:MAG: GDP-mannose mannosyl hydrolase [Planctomycetota bacterium]|jgi:colanic acid biosynthesis protein WcaH